MSWKKGISGPRNASARPRPPLPPLLLPTPPVAAIPEDPVADMVVVELLACWVPRSTPIPARRTPTKKKRASSVPTCPA